MDWLYWPCTTTLCKGDRSYTEKKTFFSNRWIQRDFYDLFKRKKKGDRTGLCILQKVACLITFTFPLLPPSGTLMSTFPPSRLILNPLFDFRIAEHLTIHCQSNTFVPECTADQWKQNVRDCPQEARSICCHLTCRVRRAERRKSTIKIGKDSLKILIHAND